MIDLDNLEVYRQFDHSGMLGQLKDFPNQCQRAWQRALEFPLPPKYSGIDKVVITGMGGSAIGAEMVSCLALPESKVPIIVRRDYDLPVFIDGNTLLITSSYSGNTEETLTGFTASLKTSAKKIVITSGGNLKKLAEEQGIPVFIIDYQAPPRVAFPHSFFPLVGILQRIGLLKDKSADFTGTIKILNTLANELAESTPFESNIAKQLATKLLSRIAVVYGAEFLSSVAQRWKTQFNENGKNWAFFELFPELNHNAIVAYGFPPEVREKLFVFLLHSPLLHQRISIRYEATTKLLEKAGINHEFVKAKGESILAQMMNLTLLGDFTSFYLAILNQLDPRPVESIDYIKDYLSKFPFTPS